MKYQRHPIGACYRDLTPEEKAKLKAGLHDPNRSPAYLYEGKVLDGWQYCLACEEERIEPKFATVEFPTWAQAIEFVVRRNEGRRQMDDDDRAEVAEKLANLNNGKRPSSIDEASPVTLPQAAKLLKVSETSIDRARYIKKRAVPEVKEAYKAKKITRDRARAIAGLPKEEQAVELAKWINKDPTRNGNSKPSRRSILAARMQELTKDGLKLTREQIDPDFKGTPQEWVDKYGHVQVMTKVQLEADRKNAALMNSISALNDLREPLEKYLALPPFDLIELAAYINKSPERRMRKLGEMVSLIAKAKESIEPILPLLNAN